MTSLFSPKNQALSDNKNCTIASTFEKAKSLKFELLFGDYQEKISQAEGIDYYFSVGQIFGFACQSQGLDFQKFNHAFIVRACAPGELGSIVTGISPGAEILVKTLSSASSLRLRAILETLIKSNINLSHISDSYYRKLDQLLEAKISTNYLIGELIGEKNRF